MFGLSTLLYKCLIILLNTFSYLNLNNLHKFLTKFSITRKNYFWIISSYNKVMRILNIFSNISTNNSVNNIVITHSSWKTSIFFFLSIIRIKSLLIKFRINFPFKKSIFLFNFIITSNTFAGSNNIIATIGIVFKFIPFGSTNTLLRKIKIVTKIHIYIRFNLTISSVSTINIKSINQTLKTNTKIFIAKKISTKFFHINTNYVSKTFLLHLDFQEVSFYYYSHLEL